MSMENFLIFIPTNLFRTYVHMRFLGLFLEHPKEKAKHWIQFGSMMFYFLLNSFGYILFHNPRVNILTNIVGLFVVSLSFLGNIKKKILSVCIIYTLSMLCDVIVVISCVGFAVERSISELLGVMTALLITVCELLAEKLIYKKKNPGFISPNWMFLLFIPLCSIGMIHLCIIDNLTDRNFIVLVGIGLLVINIISFFLYSAMERTYLVNLENELLIQTSDIYRHQLDIIMKTQDQIRSLQHDMKYHIRALLAMAGSGNTEGMISYLEEMEKETENPDQYVDSGNKELDGNLNYLLKEANHKLKDVSVKIVVPLGAFTSSFDINVLLSNLLENAITASENTQEKMLHLKLVTKKGLLYIEIENSYNGIINEEKGRFYTTKNNKAIHGFGLKNVKRIVEKHNGTLDITYSEERFRINIMLYLTNLVKEL